ncbi:MAG: hypothetical protein ACLQF4_13270 [Xanthobacteraceae bacterium]
MSEQLELLGSPDKLTVIPNNCGRGCGPRYQNTGSRSEEPTKARFELIDELDVARLPVLVESRFQRTMALADFCVILVRF